MKAREMFGELGFKLHNQGEDFLLYKYETDYDEVFIYFDLYKKLTLRLGICLSTKTTGILSLWKNDRATQGIVVNTGIGKDKRIMKLQSKSSKQYIGK